MRLKIFMLLVMSGVLLACSEQGGDQPVTRSTALVGQAEQVGSDVQETAGQDEVELQTAGTESLADTAATLAVAAEDRAESAQASAAQQLADTGQSLQNTAQKVVDTAVLETDKVSAAVIPAEQLDMGKRVYSGNCMACHSAGVAGAPRLGDTQAWSLRIGQGLDTLYDHAINGFNGNTGYMPAKGGYASLNDDEVKAAVAYMVFESK